MSASANKQMLQHIFDELSIGNSRPLIDSMADDFSWTVMGTNKWSGAYEGKQAVLNELLAPLRSQLEGQYTSAHRFIAENDLVVVECEGHAVTKTGKPYNNKYCFVIRVVDGKLRELTEYADTELVAAALGPR